MTQPERKQEPQTDDVFSRLRDTRIASIEPATPPGKLRAEIPVTIGAAHSVLTGRQETTDIITGSDKRLEVIVGPCSIHDPESALEYAKRLAPLRERYADRLAIKMRVYFEKPRTSTGWKGFVNTPGLTGPSNVEVGRRKARKLMLDINELGLPVATELLDPLNPRYFSDLIAWGAVGARTTESQTHREMGSGMSCPIGMKNGTGGSLMIAINAMISAQSPHTFLSIDDDGVHSIVDSKGNPLTQLILRGGSNGPNYDYSSVVQASALLCKYNLSEQIIVDCSHANAEGDYRRQIDVLDEVLKLRREYPEEYTVSTVMIESNLSEGKQKLNDPADLEYGVSITDGCVGWEQTEEMLEQAYAMTA